LLNNHSFKLQVNHIVVLLKKGIKKPSYLLLHMTLCGEQDSESSSPWRETRDYYGNTLLMQAVLQDHYEQMILLIRNGANPNAINYEGRTAAHLAISKPKALFVLVRIGANVNAPGLNGETPLHIAAAAGDDDAIRLLVRAGAHLNAIDEDGETALHWAVRQEENESTLKLLLHLGVDKNAKNYAGETPLHLAACCGHTKFVRILLASGANIFEADYEGSCILQEAKASGFTEIVSLLETHGATHPKVHHGAHQLLFHVPTSFRV